MDYKVEQKIISDFLANSSLKDFIVANFQESLVSIGFSKKLIDTLTSNLSNLEISRFQSDFSDELEKIYCIGFFQKIVPAYFEQFVIPEIPEGKVLDVGCGTGILIKKLSEVGFHDLVGIDINEYPEWQSFSSRGARFEVVSENQFPKFLVEHQPDAITLTWALHHMRYDEQERYLKMIFEKMKDGSKIVVLEDSYSEELHPENSEERWRTFMKWPESARKKIMSVYDWVANRVLAKREHVPIPFGYRTMEEWIKLFTKIGYGLISRKFIGFPDQRDINTPQSLLIFRK